MINRLHRLSKQIGTLALTVALMALLFFNASPVSVLQAGVAFAQGVYHYVDNEASGNNDGTSWEHAWESFAAIDWGSIQPGDTVYISGGTNSKTYTEMLTVGASGSAGSPITIKVGQEAGHNGTVIITNDDDSDPGQRGGINILSKDYVTIDGNVNDEQRMRVTGCAGEGILVANDVSYVRLTYLEIDNNGNSGGDDGIELNNLNDGTERFELDHSKIHDNWQDQISMPGSPGPEQFGRFLIHDNDIYNLSDDGLEGGLRGLDFYNNTMHGQVHGKGEGHPDGIQYYVGYMRIFNNAFYNIQDDVAIANAYLEIGTDQQGTRSPSHVYVYNNLIYHSLTPSEDSVLRGIELSMVGSTPNVSNYVFANNTIVGIPRWAIVVALNTPMGADNVDNVQFVNNVIHNSYQNPTYGAPILFIGEGDWTIGSVEDNADVTFDYNILSAGDVGRTDIDYRGTMYTYEQFVTLTGSQDHGMEAAPLLDADYKPTVDSPVVDAGLSMSSFFSHDKAGYSRPQGGGWDMGAYEFLPDLELHGRPGNQTIDLDWNVNGALPVTSTWQIDYASETGTVLVPPITIPTSTVRSHTLTGLTNYVWYTVTLNAMLDASPILTDTVRVMPTDRFVYLPLVLRGN